MGPSYSQWHLLRFRGKKGTVAFLRGLHFLEQGPHSLLEAGSPIPHPEWMFHVPPTSGATASVFMSLEGG